MSVKHLRDEYQRICNEYVEMVDTVHELELAVTDNIVSPEKLDDIKQSLEIIKANYMRWCWVMHLLDTPNKKEKQKKYNKQFKNRIEKNNSIKSEHQENKDALTLFKDKINSLN